jgi:hypothetical protein
LLGCWTTSDSQTCLFCWLRQVCDSASILTAADLISWLSTAGKGLGCCNSPAAGHQRPSWHSTVPEQPAEMMHEAANLQDTANQRPAKRGRAPSAKKLVKQEEELQQVCHTAAHLCKAESPRMLHEIDVLVSTLVLSRATTKSLGSHTSTSKGLHSQPASKQWKALPACRLSTTSWYLPET